MEVVPIVDSANGTPCLAAARAPATSPSVCIIRVNPVGAMPTGRLLRPPRTSTDRSTAGTGRSTCGRSSTWRKAAQLRRRPSSPLAAPST